MAKETLKNNNSIEIIGKGITTVSSDTVDPGFDEEKKVFSISGRVTKNKPTVVATLRVDAAANKRFLKAPGLTSGEYNIETGNKSKLKTRFKSIEKDDNGNKIAYLYDLIYTAKEKVTQSNKLIYNIENEVSSILTKNTGIIRVFTGSSHIDNFGENRKLTIQGAPNTSFILSINKFTDSKDTDGEILSSTETSIINAGSNQAIENDSFGEEYASLSVKTDSNGLYSFSHRFPSITTETRYSINIKKQNISNTFNTTDWLSNRDGWDNWYSKILTQHVNPVLTLKTTTTGWSTVTIDTNGDNVFETFNSSTPITKSYTGRYNTMSSNVKSTTVPSTISVTHVIKSASQAFSDRSGSDGSGGTLGTPLFSNVTGYESDWTNSIWQDDPDNGFVGNGGTIVDIVDISAVKSTTSSSNDTLTLKYTVNILKWGTKDVTMTLNVDEIKTLS